MSIRGFFKNITGDDAAPAPAPAPTADPATPSGEEKGTAAGGGFFAGTSRFLDSVQAKKNGLMSDISNKLGSIKFGESTDENVKETRLGGDEDEDSSASEYGDGGDRPYYADAAPEGRRGSNCSVDSLSDTEANQYKEFIKQLVDDLFTPESYIADSRKSTFKSYVAHHTGRSSFAKEVQNQRSKQKAVSESLLKRLVEYFALALFECNNADDFGPAKVLMSMCFTFYFEKVTPDGKSEQHYVYMNLRDQPIWQSLRFWNAAFFEAIQQERAGKPAWKQGDSEAELKADKEFQENITFGQLSTFTWNMVSLGLTRDVCIEFLRKQAGIANLSREKAKIIRTNIEKWTASA